MVSREIGLHEDGERWIVVFPSRETRDKKRSISFPAEAHDVLRDALAPHHSPVGINVRKGAVVRALERRDRQSIGALATEALDELGEDSENQTLRRQMCGMINTCSELGMIVRINDNGKELFCLPEGHKKKG